VTDVSRRRVEGPPRQSSAVEEADDRLCAEEADDRLYEHIVGNTIETNLSVTEYRQVHETSLTGMMDLFLRLFVQKSGVLGFSKSTTKVSSGKHFMRR
jgi:hypothetical protein